ncbi:DUF2752 domain-containing protein [Fodinicola feengrottensis]|uniref:DUF2752 domain-containing protein n=1 Tax=Fodinicola feengrottensis TaxID=435914 RepID=UPI0024418254|nr:DUF2752 domain-containing protein [Fodinicola feengrottensis]
MDAYTRGRSRPTAGRRGLVWVLRFNPTDNVADPTGPCPWHALTGINGPGCGGTRAFYYLVHGDLIDAARNHLPFTIAAPFLLYWWIAWLTNTFFGIRLPRLKPSALTVAVFIVSSVVFTTVLRNIPLGPMAWFDIPSTTARIW